MKNQAPQIISHDSTEDVDFQEVVNAIEARLISEGDKPHVTLQEELIYLKALTRFELGRYMLMSKGLNGYWIDYILRHPQNGRITGMNSENQPFTQMESFLLDAAPICLATQQRYEIFLAQNQKAVKNHAVLASIPCGVMAELSPLNYSAVTQLELVGVDLDTQALEQSKYALEERGLLKWGSFIQEDLWQLDLENAFDLISCNGLTIYENSDERVLALYKILYRGLKPGGRLVTSYITPSPVQTKNCEWDFKEINQEDLRLQLIIMKEIVQAKFNATRSTEQTHGLLTQAGFKGMEYIYDKAKMFPTVVAYK
jgi:SAM-dependent methyltransferase